jgi:hypothetical protein
MKEIEKPDAKCFFDDIQDPKEEYCVEDKADNEFYPSGQTRCVDNDC